MTREQAEALGITERMRRARLRSGAWVKMHPGVYRMVAVPTSTEQAMLAACLWGGAGTLVSHRSAAALWRLEGFSPNEPTRLEVTSVRDLRTKKIRVHRATTPRAREANQARRASAEESPERRAREEAAVLRLVDQHTRHGIPVTSVARTLLDLCAVAPHEVEFAFNDALRRRLVTLPDLQGVYQRDVGAGTPGLSLFRRLVEQLTRAGGHTDSWLETATSNVLTRAGFRPRRQHRVHTEGRTFRLDFAFPDQKVAVEAQGYRYHHSVSDWSSDQARHSALAAAGWTMLLTTAKELERAPQTLLEGLRRALGEAPAVR